jgi:hypothetical protein
VDALVCNRLFWKDKPCNALAMKNGECSSNHSDGILPKDAFQQQALEEHQQWTADHEDQQGDHCQVPEEMFTINTGRFMHTCSFTHEQSDIFVFLYEHAYPVYVYWASIFGGNHRQSMSCCLLSKNSPS